MAITGPTSFVSTTQQFITHWTAVNAILPPTEKLILPDGMTIATFTTQRNTLLTMRDDVENADVDVPLARANLEIKKEWLHAKLNLFNEAVAGKLPGSVYARTLTLVPGIGDGQENFTKPMKGARRIWEMINNATPPVLPSGLVLKDGTTQSTFAAAIIELAALYDLVTDAEKDVSITIAKREDVEDVLYAAMKQYRLSAPTVLAAGNALLETIPRLTPDGGRTPAPVELFGGYDAVNLAADLNWPASPDPDLDEYEVRVTFGPTWSDSNNHIAGTVAAGGPRVLKTTKGLQTPGAVAAYKVYVRLKSGGEAGSNVVLVSRPA